MKSILLLAQVAAFVGVALATPTPHQDFHLVAREPHKHHCAKAGEEGKRCKPKDGVSKSHSVHHPKATGGAGEGAPPFANVTQPSSRYGPGGAPAKPTGSPIPGLGGAGGAGGVGGISDPEISSGTGGEAGAGTGSNLPSKPTETSSSAELPQATDIPPGASPGEGGESGGSLEETTTTLTNAITQTATGPAPTESTAEAGGVEGEAGAAIGKRAAGIFEKSRVSRVSIAPRETAVILPKA